MSQQTSINDFYKSVNPKTIYSQVNKKLSANPIVVKKQRAAKSKVRMSQAESLVSTPSKASEDFSNQSTNSDDDFANLVECVDDSTPLAEGIATQKLSPPTNIPTTPKKDGKKGVKRTLPKSPVVGSPKKRQQSSGTRAVTKHLKNRTTKKLFNDEAIDGDKVCDTIDNLNLSRAGIIPENQFDLEKFYGCDEIVAAKMIDYKANGIPTFYDMQRVVVPREKHAEHLFYMICNVFDDPINCGYFNDEELDLVFGIMTLSEKAQMLFARMIKRKQCWKRSSSIQYPEIADNLDIYFKELEKCGLVSSDMEDESLKTLLNILTTNDVRDICKQLNVPRQLSKESAVTQLLKNSTIKPLFPGMESPATKLRKAVLTSLSYCIRIPQAVIGLVDRIVTLFMPAEDITTTLSDLFLKLTMIKEGSLKYPEVSVERYPIFRNREHLISYVELRNKQRQAMERRGNRADWELLMDLGREADQRLRLLLRKNLTRQQLNAVPRHVQKFREEYVCMKIVTSCLEVFKKEDATIQEAVNMLRNLISQEAYLQSRKSEWYDELALIETRHKKNLEAAAVLTIEGLNSQYITETGRHVLAKRARALAKRKSGISEKTKSFLKDLTDKETQWTTPKVVISADVMHGNQPGRKSTWELDMGGGDKGYVSVEYRAKYYYQNNGYSDGWHCEGSLPVTLFTLLMWDELYGVSVPAAYLSAYQKAPLDLFTSEFYKNRKKRLDTRLEELKAMSNDQLAELTERSYEIRQHYECLMPNGLPTNVDSKGLRDIIRCIGTDVVTGICKRLASNFTGWRSGFPDLLVWNPHTLQCKFVEVKGPGDTLSPKQSLWLKYLEELGAATELCEVQGEPCSFITPIYHRRQKFVYLNFIRIKILPFDDEIHKARASGTVSVQGPMKCWG